MKALRGRPAKAQAQLDVLKDLQQASASWLLDVSGQTLRSWADAPRNPDGNYDGRALVAWMLAKSGGEDAELGSGSSINLEKYRAEKARAAKRENEVAEGLLLYASDVDAAIAATMAAFRVELEALGRVGGAAIADEISKMIDRAAASLEERFKKK